MSVVGSRSSPNDTSERAPDPEEALRRSAEAIRAMDATLGDRRQVLDAADATLARTGRLLATVDIDLAAVERASGRVTATPPIRVLVVDDNPTICDVLRILLTVEFADTVDVRCVTSGHQALEAATWHPQVVIVDWMMPGMDGLATARELRPRVPDARIVMYSSRLAVEGEPQARAAGADRYIEKGADTATIVDEVRAAMAGTGARVSR